MPLTASDITNRRKGLALSYDAYNNQRPTNPQAFTTYTETYDALAAGQKIAVSQQLTGSYICSIPIDTFQQLCASNGTNPTLSELVKATNVNSMIAQGPAAGINVVQLSGGGIAAYCNSGTFLGAVDAAGNPISLPNPIIPNSTWMALVIDGASNNSSTIQSITMDNSGNLYVLGQFTSTVQAYDAGITTPILHSPLITLSIPDVPGTNTKIFLVKYNSSGIAQWATQIYLKNIDYTNIDFTNQIKLVFDNDNSRIYITLMCSNNTDIYNGVNSGTPGSVAYTLSLPTTTNNGCVVAYSSVDGSFSWVMPVTSTNNTVLNLGSLDYRNGTIIFANAYRANASFYNAVSSGPIGSAVSSLGTANASTQAIYILKIIASSGVVDKLTFLRPTTPNNIVANCAVAIGPDDSIYLTPIIRTSGLQIFNTNNLSLPSSFTTFTRVTSGFTTENLCIVKYNSSLIYQWTSPVVGTFIDGPTVLVVSDNGDVIVAYNAEETSPSKLYTTSSTDSGIFASTTNSATCIVKYNNSGNPQWINVIDNIDTVNKPSFILSDLDNNIYVISLVDINQLIDPSSQGVTPTTWNNTPGNPGTPDNTSLLIKNDTDYNYGIIIKYNSNGGFSKYSKILGTSDITFNSLVVYNSNIYAVGLLGGTVRVFGLSDNNSSQQIYSYSRSAISGFLVNIPNN